MALDISVITEDDIASHMNQGNNPLIGVDITTAELVGKPLAQSPQGVCGLQKWIEAQTGYSAYLTFGFGSDGSRWKMVLKDPVTEEVVKMWGDKYVTGSGSTDIGFAGKHERLGYMLIYKLARKIADQLEL